jgi:hypothetical protein
MKAVRRFIATAAVLVAATLAVTVSASADTTLNLPPDQVVEATGPDGATVTFTATAEEDGNPVVVTCSPESGSTFSIGTTQVSCSTPDNTSGSFNVTVQDTTAPTISGADGQTVEATAPSGAAATFAPTASDAVDGTVSVQCTPASGTTFALGSTTVSCTATDSHTNSANASFDVTVVDTTAPSLQGVPAPAPAEANGPSGSKVFFSPPTATDLVDPGPLAVSCLPPSGATFALGVTVVTCSATDASANKGTATFDVRVVDTKPPVLTVPPDTSVTATSPSGVPASDPSLAAFLGGAKANDLVDPAPVVTNDAPTVFPVGTTTVSFNARDASGNRTSQNSKLTVSAPAGPPPAPAPTPTPTPPAPTPPTARDTTPPGDVRRLVARAGNRVVRLSWALPGDPDFDHVAVLRSDASATEKRIYQGAGTRFTDRNVKNKIQYRYLVVAYDQAGNGAAGASVAAFPQRVLLTAPADAARVRTPPLLKWQRWPKAQFYNVQLFRGTTKVLSAWPKKTQFQLSRRWTYGGARRTLSPGTYRWYVWPAFGPRKKPEYGGVLGSSTFVVTS